RATHGHERADGRHRRPPPFDAAQGVTEPAHADNVARSRAVARVGPAGSGVLPADGGQAEHAVDLDGLPVALPPAGLTPRAAVQRDSAVAQVDPYFDDLLRAAHRTRHRLPLRFPQA